MIIDGWEYAKNCLIIQESPMGPGDGDVCVVAEDGEGFDEWRRQLIAASSLSSKYAPKSTTSSNGRPKGDGGSVLVFVRRVYIRNCGPFESPAITAAVASREGLPMANFAPITLPKESMFPDKAGVVSASTPDGSKFLIGRGVRTAAGEGSTFIIEVTNEGGANEGAGGGVYWGYVPLDGITHGDLEIPLYKKPTIFDPLQRPAGSLAAKNGSCISVAIRVSGGGAGVKEAVGALVNAVRRAGGGGFDVKGLEEALEGLYVLDEEGGGGGGGVGAVKGVGRAVGMLVRGDEGEGGDREEVNRLRQALEDAGIPPPLPLPAKTGRGEWGGYQGAQPGARVRGFPGRVLKDAECGGSVWEWGRSGGAYADAEDAVEGMGLEALFGVDGVSWGGGVDGGRHDPPPPLFQPKS